MSYILGGAFGGLLMASVSATAGPLMLFFLARDPSPVFTSILRRVSPMHVTIGLVVLAYPAWTLVGALLGLLYRAALQAAPGGGLGSPNLVFTLAIISLTVIVAAPAVLLVRRVVAGIAAMAVVFVGVFGWLVPHVVQRSTV